MEERDKEISLLKATIEEYKQVAAKEVANKTKLAKSLDESSRHAIQLEDTLQQWRLSMTEQQQQIEQLIGALQQERVHSVDLEKRFGEVYGKKQKEVEQLTAQLSESRKGRSKDRKGNRVDSTVDETQIAFLKQAVYHLLTDSHAEEHVRAIVSILNFSAQERKAVYSKVQERKAKSGKLMSVYNN